MEKEKMTLKQIAGKDFKDTVETLRLCESAVGKAVDIYRKVADPFKSIEFEKENECKKLGKRFPKTLRRYSTASENLYSVLFFDSSEKKIVLVLVHEEKEFCENKLAEISEFAKTAKSPNGILPNKEYLGSNKHRYDPANLPANKIVFCKQYACDSIMKQSVLEEFTHDCNEVFQFHETIIRHMKLVEDENSQNKW